jgi:hypothetical protein
MWSRAVAGTSREELSSFASLHEAKPASVLLEMPQLISNAGRGFDVEHQAVVDEVAVPGTQLFGFCLGDSMKQRINLLQEFYLKCKQIVIR